MGIEIDGMPGSGKVGSPGSVTDGRDIDGSKLGSDNEIGNERDGMPGKGSVGRPGSVTDGNDIDGSKLGSDSENGIDIEGIVGSGSEGSPGNVTEGRPQDMSQTFGRARAARYASTPSPVTLPPMEGLTIVPVLGRLGCTSPKVLR